MSRDSERLEKHIFKQLIISLVVWALKVVIWPFDTFNLFDLFFCLHLHFSKNWLKEDKWRVDVSYFLYFLLISLWSTTQFKSVQHDGILLLFLIFVLSLIPFQFIYLSRKEGKPVGKGYSIGRIAMYFCHIFIVISNSKFFFPSLDLINE